ncbi:MAG: response regulator transcription factor [Kiritimatiellae bacterium]|nr:response regulator transcription factor [Kiritimatiellia bacterium]
MSEKITLLLVDDHSIVRIGLKALINYQKDMSIVGEAKNGEEAIRLVRKLQPDVVIMDLMMPKLNGADATKQILCEYPNTKIIILTSYGTSADLARAVANGAVGAQIKDAPPENLLAAVRSAVQGKTAYASELKPLLMEPPPELTDLQLKMLGSVVRGLSNTEIATEFGLSLISTKRKLAAIFLALGAANRAEAAGIALQKHLLKL